MCSLRSRLQANRLLQRLQRCVPVAFYAEGMYLQGACDRLTYCLEVLCKSSMIDNPAESLIDSKVGLSSERRLAGWLGGLIWS